MYGSYLYVEFHKGQPIFKIEGLINCNKYKIKMREMFIYQLKKNCMQYFITGSIAQ